MLRVCKATILFLKLEHLDFAGPVLRRPLEIRDGRAVASSDPGIGLDWNEGAVERMLAG